MKVLLVSNMYPSDANPGYGVFVKEAEKDLISCGHIVDKAVISENKNSKLSKIYKYISFYLYVIYRGIVGKYDYIYLHFVSHSSLPVLFLNMLGVKTKIVSHVHGGDVKFLAGNNKYLFRIKRFISKSIMDKSDVIVFPSKSYMDMVSREYSLDTKKSKAVYPSGGIPDEFFNDTIEIKENKKIKIGYAGRLVKSKNVDIIVKALSGLENCNLEIVGDGVEKSNIINIVKKLDLSDRVSFHGIKSKSELIDWYSNIDILVYPSDSESLGLVPLEAMARGCYTVLSNIPAFREIVDFGINASVLDDVCKNSISLAIKNHQELSECEKEKIANGNRVLIQKVYSKAVVREAINNVFK